MWFHLPNIIFHCANVALVYFIALFLFKSFWSAGLSAVFFGLHPITSEVVSFTAIFGDIICFFFISITVILFAKYCFTGHNRFFLGSLFSLLAALLSKEVAVIGPFLVILTWIYMRRIKPDLKVKYPALLCYFILLALYLFMRPHTGLDWRALLPTFQKFTKSAYYIRDLVLPLELPWLKTFVYQRALLSVVIWSGGLWSILFIISSLKLKRLKERNYLFIYLLAWVGLTLIIPILTPFSPARRHLYIPLLGYSLFLIPAAFLFIKRKALAVTFILSLSLLSATTTWSRNILYKYSGEVVERCLASLKQALPHVSPDDIIFLVTIPGRIDNTYAFHGAVEEKIRYIYNDRNLRVYPLSSITFTRRRSPQISYEILDKAKIVLNLKTSPDEYITLPETRGLCDYQIENDHYGHIRKLTMELTPPESFKGSAHLIGFKDNNFFVMGKFRQ